MKLIDKFLKKLNCNRNTFATYILTLLSVYIAVDRIVEILVMIFTGVSISYWGPIEYTLALACPVFAFLFSPQSEFAKSKQAKVTLFYVYVIGIYIIALSMFVQWTNELAWLLFLSVPNYTEIITEFADLVKPAFTALALYLPLVTVFPLIKKLVLGVDDSTEMVRSIWDYRGIGLSKDTEGKGPYSCEMYMFTDKENGKVIKMPERQRFQPMLVVGATGSGKTSLVYEPLMARDLEKKYFFREASKEMGFTALKTGIATLNSPYDNKYLNENFNLNMLKPAYGKDKLYKAYMKKLILSDSYNDIIYKNVGVTCLSPDYEVLEHMMEVCDNFHIKYNLIDPSSITSLGLNPFTYDNPSKIAITISSVLKGMYLSKNPEKEDAYSEDVTLQAVENVTILLKEMYPRMNEGNLPNLEDMLKLLTNFELVEKMCRIMESDEKLAEEYAIQLAYFKQSFYKGGASVEDTKKAIYASVAQLDNLLRMPGVKSVLCNRHQNINFDEMLANGEVTFICTRRGELGATSHVAFGLFFLLSMQNSVLSRPGNEDTRVPNFLYIDEFPDYICKATEPIFTMYRKYRVGTTISCQNLAQLEAGQPERKYRETITVNCRHKIVTGGVSPEDAEWWTKEFNRRRAWVYGRNMDLSKLEYEDKISGVKYDWEDYTKPGKIMAMPFKTCTYKIITGSITSFGEATLDFLNSKYKEPKPIKEYDFTKFTSAGIEKESAFQRKKKRPKSKYLQNEEEIDPIQTDGDYLFDNEDAISVPLNRRKKN